jgi:hypothetical protein
MQIIIQEGDPEPAGVIGRDGRLITEFIRQTNTDGQVVFSGGNCNSPIENRFLEPVTGAYVVDNDGIITSVR